VNGDVLRVVVEEHTGVHMIRNPPTKFWKLDKIYIINLLQQQTALVTAAPKHNLHHSTY